MVTGNQAAGSLWIAINSEFEALILRRIVQFGDLDWLTHRGPWILLRYALAIPDRKMLSQTALEYGITPAEAVVLMTVGYEIPLRPPSFIKHAVWESIEEFDEHQMAEAFDSSILKHWICVTQQGLVEFTDEGETIWSDIRQELQKRREQQAASQAQRTLQDEENQRREELTDWREWTDAWKSASDHRFSEGTD